MQVLSSMEDSRHTLEFTVAYSIHLESMMSTLMGRIDRWCSFGQILLGAAVVAQFAPMIFGVLVMVIGAMQFVWQFGAASQEAKASHDRWLDLHYRIAELDASQLNVEVRKITERDTRVLSSLKTAAHLKAAQQLELDADETWKVRWWQKPLVFLAGG